MKLSCPACNAEFTLDVLMSHDGAREAVKFALLMPAPLGSLVLRYLGMFRPAKRQLAWDRVASILGELQPMIAAGQIMHKGRVWPAPQDYWTAALQQMVIAADSKKLTLPLASHGYLLAIIAGMGDKAEAKVETSTYQARAGGLTALPDAPAHGFATGDTVDVIAGTHKGWSGRIDQVQPRFARVELTMEMADGPAPTNEFINVPFSHLQKVAP